MTEEAILERYRLNRNPFSEVSSGPLTPTGNDEAQWPYAVVDGFGRALPNIKTWCQAANRPSEKCAYVLIHGRRGSGRTSTANLVAYLLFTRRYAAIDHAHVNGSLGDDDKQSLIQVSVNDESFVKPLKDAIEEFHNQLLLSGIQPSAQKDPNLYADIDKSYLATTDPSATGLYRSLLTRLFILMVEKGGKRPFFLFENLRNYAQVESIITNVRAALVILTTESVDLTNQLTSKFKDAQMTGLTIRLGTLLADDVATLIDHRWKQCSHDCGGSPPFEGTETAFSGTWLIKTVALLLSHIFSAHVERLKLADNASPLPSIDDKFMYRYIVDYYKRESET